MKKLKSGILMVSLICMASPASGAWIPDGTPLSTATGNQQEAAIVSDGAGGAIVAWEDSRSGNSDIYAQRIDAWGVVQWTVDGVALCTASGDQKSPTITSDGAGGAVVTWYDNRSASSDIYAQRVDASGTVQWTADGVALCTATGNQWYPTIASDNAGGAIITWQDPRTGGSDIYVQRVDASGTVQWTADGVAICANAAQQFDPMIARDGAGGAIISWRDYRSGNYDIYAQRVNASGAVQWTTDGVALCTAAGHQEQPAIITDDASGAIVTWRDNRSGGYDIYAQRVDASGAAQWTANGVALCTATGDQWSPTIITDGAGGAMVAWQDKRSGNWDIYAQWIDASGTVLWTANGVALCTATDDQERPSMALDGAGGAFVTWHDRRSGVYTDIYAQRIDVSGTIKWATDGLALCTATERQYYPTAVVSTTGSVIVTWQDLRSGTDSDMYAQGLAFHGDWGQLAPSISSVHDVPGDQGGWARVYFDKSRLDSETEGYRPATGYYVFRRIDDVTMQMKIAREGSPVGSETVSPIRPSVGTPEMSVWPDGARVSSNYGRAAVTASPAGATRLDGRLFVVSEASHAVGQPPGTWEVVASVPAHQDSEYICLVPTLADSTSSLVHSVYCISVETTTPWVYYFSPPDSGYSVDNLSPCPPAALAAEYIGGSQLYLHWNPNREADLSHYAIYRGTTPDFVPDETSRRGTATDSSFVDDDFGYEYYYKVSAMDVHENESPFSLLSPDMITGTPGGDRPYGNALFQNTPNPFLSSTRIAFSTKEEGRVRLSVFDARGRLVKVLVDGVRGPSQYVEQWDGRDGNRRLVPAGTYFYSLEAPGWSNSKKMTLAR